MKKIIELTQDKFARLSDREPFLMPDELYLEFNSIGYDLTNTFVSIKNGTIEDRFLLESPLKVPEDFLFSGNLFISLDCYINGKLAKHWDMIPIQIIETQNKMYAFDLLFKIEKQLEELKENVATKEELNRIIEKVNETIKKQNELADTVSEIKEGE